MGLRDVHQYRIGMIVTGIVAGPAAGLRCDFRNPPLKRCFAVRAPIPRPVSVRAVGGGQLTTKVTSSMSKAVTPLPAVSTAPKVTHAVRSVAAAPLPMLYCRHCGPPS